MKSDHRNYLSYLAECSKVPVDRIEFHSEADVSLIDDIELGILFVMAFWSGPAFIAFANITDVLNRLDPTERLRFVVIDTDRSPSFHLHPNFPDCGRTGNGETAWIRHGKIESFSRFRTDISDIEDNTKALLEST